MAVNGKTVQRITIIIIAVVMTVGTLGAYFIVILQQHEQNAAVEQATNYPEYPVDETAHKVEDKVSELKIIDEKMGEGPEVKLGDTIKVHYKGTFAQSGQKFDSSYDDGEPVEFKLEEGGLIKGWTEGVPGMKAGGKRILEIPADKAYGAAGVTGSIPPNTDLVFEIELISISQ